MTYRNRTLFSQQASALACLAALGLASFAAAGTATPTLDGDIEDLIQYSNFLDSSGEGCGLEILDPPGDIVVADPKVVPCDPAFIQGISTYFVNGFDQTLGVVAYSGGTLYLGIRVAGVVGDPDGNGDPNTSCPASTIQDAAGIEEAATYEWRFDTNCDGIFESIVTVSNNTITLTGITGSGSFAFNGSDLEVQVTGANLSPLFAVRSFTGHREDGLGEDLSPLGQCPPPDLGITLVKTVNPATICPGQTTTVTLQVCNLSTFDQTGVSLNDVLPAGFNYVPGSVTGIGAPSGTGTLAFPVFGLTAGECRTITFQAASSPNCFGQVANVASVSGTLTHPCLPPPGTVNSVDTDTAFINCQPLPTCTIIGPDSVCSGSVGAIYGVGAAAGATVNWTISGNGNISGPATGSSVSVNVGASGSFTLTVYINQGGCVATCTRRVTVGPGNFNCNILCPPIFICPGDTKAFSIQSPVPGVTYTWTVDSGAQIVGPNTGTSVQVMAGPGNFNISVTTNGNSCAGGCSRVVEVGVGSITCTISGPNVIHPNSTYAFTVGGAPVGSFQWTISGNAAINGPTTSATVSVTSGLSGSFTLSVVPTIGTGCGSGCSLARSITPVAGSAASNCPASITFWRAQCNGAAVFTPAQMGLITAAVDLRAGAFNWANDFSSFCAVLNPPATTNRSDALAQYAALLANLAADEQNQVTTSGHQVYLNPNTPVSFGGFTATTLGQLVAQIDFRLALLAGGSASSSEYLAATAAAGAINSGLDIGPVCQNGDFPAGESGRFTNPRTVHLSHAYPNPFRDNIRVQYAVEGHLATEVSVAVYDVTGRLVRRLQSGSLPPGSHEASWDGLSGKGERVPNGVYFVRIVSGSDQATTRILFAR